MFLCPTALVCGYRLAAEAMHYYCKVSARSFKSKVTKAGWDGDENMARIHYLYHHNYCHANVIIQTIKMMYHWKSQAPLLWES